VQSTFNTGCRRISRKLILGNRTIRYENNYSARSWSYSWCAGRCYDVQRIFDMFRVLLLNMLAYTGKAW